MSLSCRPVWEYITYFGVPEGGIWPRKAAEEPVYVDGCRHLPFMNFRCFMFAAFSGWVASLLHCLNKCFPVPYLEAF